MKIEIIECNNISERCKGGTCFEAPSYVANAIKAEKAFLGIVLIDNDCIKFSFSCMGMDGDIFTTNESHRTIVKHVVPLYAYNRFKENSKFHPF